eukprot:scaffold126469_cov90-Phaeocystis_antarctica.AAC.3
MGPTPEWSAAPPTETLLSPKLATLRMRRTCPGLPPPHRAGTQEPRGTARLSFGGDRRAASQVRADRARTFRRSGPAALAEEASRALVVGGKRCRSTHVDEHATARSDVEPRLLVPLELTPRAVHHFHPRVAQSRHVPPP